MKQIPLSQGLFALVDDEDFEWLNRWKWSAIIRGNLIHARRTDYTENGPVRIYMHRQILGITDRSLFVDHKNGNGLDNRRCNLRSCSRMENGYNRGAPKHSRTGLKGVANYGKYGQWQATIRAQGVTTRLGIFKSPIDAAKAYDEACKRLHGEFARPNF